MILSPKMTIQEMHDYLMQAQMDLLRVQNNTKRSIVIKFGEMHDEEGNVISPPDFIFRLKPGEIRDYPRYIAIRFIQRRATPLGILGK